MSLNNSESSPYDVAPGFMDAAHRSVRHGVQTYLIGLVLSALLTAAAFYLADSTLVWEPAIPVALSVLAVAQIGVHLVFFLHLTSGPDNVNNALALAFGTLIVTLVIGGSLWIMYRLNQNMLPMEMRPAHVAHGGGALTAEGVVQPIGAAPVSAKVSGLIQSVDCDVGMRVKAGERCAKIDPRAYEADLSRRDNALQAAENRLQQAQKSLASAQAALERSQAPRAGGPANPRGVKAARQTVERARSAVNRDESEIAARQSARDAAKAKLAETNIVAPMDGVVKSRDVQPGEWISANAEKPLFVFASDMASVNVKAAVAGKDLEKIKPGDKATFAVEGIPNKVFAGSVARITPSESGESADIVIAAPNPEGMLQPGMTTSISIAPR